MVGARRAHQVAGRRVDDPLRPGRGPRRVHEEEKVFCIHHLARAGRRIVRHTRRQVVPPDVPAVLHRHLALGPSQHDAAADLRRHRHRLVRGPLQGHPIAPPPALVLGDQHLALHVVHPARQGVRAEAAEHHRVRRAQPRAGQHRHRQLRHHAHVDRDRRPLLHPELLQPVGEADHLLLQVTEREDSPVILRLPLPVVGDLATLTGLHVPVHAVVADVELPTEVPAGVGQLPLVDRRRRFEPGHPPRAFLAPELFEVLFVDVGLRVCLLRELGRRPIAPLLQEQRLDRVSGHVWA